MVQTYSDMLVHEPAVSPSDPDYYARALETEIYNFKVIRNVPTAYTAESWDAYTSTANILLTIDPSAINDVAKSMIDNATAKRERRLFKLPPLPTVCGTSGEMRWRQPNR